jgi:hypothetical protein
MLVHAKGLLVEGNEGRDCRQSVHVECTSLCVQSGRANCSHDPCTRSSWCAVCGSDMSGQNVPWGPS